MRETIVAKMELLLSPKIYRANTDLKWEKTRNRYLHQRVKIRILSLWSNRITDLIIIHYTCWC